MSVAAGKLRDWVTIQSVAVTRDAGGGAVETWSDITDGERPGKVRPAGSRERFAGMQLQEEVTHEIKIRYLSTVTTRHRVLFGSRVFSIQSVIDWNEEHREMSLFCTERKAA